MTDREKLIELLDNFTHNVSPYAHDSKYFMVDDNCELADHLISNGVTFAKDTNVLTKADLIRAMSVEEIAQWLCLNYSCTKCPGQNLCTIDGGKHNGLTKWLKQPAEVPKEE